MNPKHERMVGRARSETDSGPARVNGAPGDMPQWRAGAPNLATAKGRASLLPMLSRRTLLVGSLVAAAGATVATRARASMARALTLTELVRDSRYALVGTPVDLFAQWETLGDHRRILTYTMVRTEYSLDGRPPATRELLVRTLGGIVDGIGQIVPGEAVLRRGETAAFFLADIEHDLFAVTGMAQGHYPVVTDKQGTRRLTMSRGALEVATTTTAAVKRLDGRALDEVEALVYSELGRAAP